MCAMQQVPIVALAHAPRRTQSITGVSPVFRIPGKVDDRKPESGSSRRAIRRFPVVIPRDRRDAYDTFRSASAPGTSPSQVPARKIRRDALPTRLSGNGRFGDCGCIGEFLDMYILRALQSGDEDLERFVKEKNGTMCQTQREIMNVI